MVKSVQRGIATISTAVTNVDVTISAVVPANSVIRCWIRGNQNSYWRDKFPVSSITNTTTINLSINATPYPNTPVIWEVVEYYDGVSKDIFKLHDHKGILTVYWFKTPIKQQIDILNEAWLFLGEPEINHKVIIINEKTLLL